MCGIAGFWGNDPPELTIAKNMANRLVHRGPDDSGAWHHPANGIAMAHRRLSIVDLSTHGHQPMLSPCKRYVLVYNGEIYNHQELRLKLQSENCDFTWRGHSDTETLLAALKHWGIPKALRFLNGAFAFALWDLAKKQLILARDRMGEKPLYYGHSHGVFLFGSELKSLRAHPNWCGTINRNALALFLRHNYVPSPWSIYENIYKLPPAHYTVISQRGHKIDAPSCYWNLAKIAEQNTSHTSHHTPTQFTDELNELLLNSVKLRMNADVPLGAFLSGGYDSTTIVALMQAQSMQPIQTFSIGFHEKKYNEAHHAKAVSDHLGTAHHQLYVTAKEAMDVIPKLPLIYDEPFSDASQIPTFLVSQLARQKVSVALSGDGGDELFFGYTRYLFAQKVWQTLARLPKPIRQSLSWVLRHTPVKALRAMQHILPSSINVAKLADQLPKLATVMQYQDGISFYRHLMSHHQHPNQLVIGATEPPTLFDSSNPLPTLPSLRECMMYIDMMTYLPDDILTKVDRASMANSLEARVPLIDHRLVEFSWRLPTAYKYREKQSKWLLRQVLDRYVPRQLMERPKMGFGVPIEHWLRGPLRDWAEALLDETRLHNDGFLNPAPVKAMWSQHMAGRRQHAFLWNVLTFQAWLDAEKTK